MAPSIDTHEIAEGAKVYVTEQLLRRGDEATLFRHATPGVLQSLAVAGVLVEKPAAPVAAPVVRKRQPRRSRS